MYKSYELYCPKEPECPRHTNPNEHCNCIKTEEGLRKGYWLCSHCKIYYHRCLKANKDTKESRCYPGKYYVIQDVPPPSEKMDPMWPCGHCAHIYKEDFAKEECNEKIAKERWEAGKEERDKEEEKYDRVRTKLRAIYGPDWRNKIAAIRHEALGEHLCTLMGL